MVAVEVAVEAAGEPRPGWLAQGGVHQLWGHWVRGWGHG